MSARSPSRAAEIAARQVESIVSAAELTAESLRAEARREGEAVRREAEADGEVIRTRAQRDAEKLAEDARRRVAQIEKEGHDALSLRLAAGEKAADEALAEAQAIHAGLRELGSGLTSHAERILRDIQGAHRRMTADLRQGERPSSAPRSLSAPAARPAPRPAGNGFDGIDVPDWVERP